MSEKKKGLKRASEIYWNRSQVGRELKAGGGIIVGYVCCYVPVEVIGALGMIPFKVFSSMREPVMEAERFVPREVCPIVKSILAQSLGGAYDFLDGLVLAHTCDAMERTSRIWETVTSTPYVHYLDIPTKTGITQLRELREGIRDLTTTLETLAGKELEHQKLDKSIEQYNEQRDLVRRLYALSRSVPPLTSGKEIMEVIGSISCLPVEQSIVLLQQVIAEVKERDRGPEEEAVRILVWGSILEDPVLIDIIECAGANVVIDDTCSGTRCFFADIENGDDPLIALAHHSLVDLRCPRTYQEASTVNKKKDYRADLEWRFSYLRGFIREWKINGVILQSARYCDCHGFEVPQVKDYLHELQIPSLYLEHDYTQQGMKALKNRVEAFVEIVSGELF